MLVWLWHFVVDGKMSSFLLSNYFQSNRFSSQRARPSLWKMKRKIWKPVIRKLKVKTRMQNLGKHVILSSSPRSTQMCCCIYYSYEFTQLIKTCDLCLIKKPAGILRQYTITSSTRSTHWVNCKQKTPELCSVCWLKCRIFLRENLTSRVARLCEILVRRVTLNFR